MLNNTEYIDSLFVINAIRDLYQMVILIDGTSMMCHVLDFDQSFASGSIKDMEDYDRLCEVIYRNINPEERAEFKRVMFTGDLEGILAGKQSHYIECRIRHTGFGYRWSRITFCAVDDKEHSGDRKYLLLAQDIHEQKTEERRKASEARQMIRRLQNENDRLNMENMIDSQTGCFNRRGLDYYKSQIISDAREKDNDLFVCVLDLNGLKYLNDTFGHSAGDEAIRTISEALKTSVPENAKIFRTGGDEFLILASVEKGSRCDAETEANFQSFLDSYNRNSGKPFTVAASYGFVLEALSDCPEHPDALVEEADKKMYQMKENRDIHRR